MSFFGKWNPALLAAAVRLAACGFSPLDQGPLDEEKEPHFVLGKSRVNAMNYPGAIEAFEQSLEANPHSAQAHYQLAMLYENQQYQQSDPAAAIYHYQQYLKYDPKAENAEIITGHISSCKQQLAADVLQLPSTTAAQRQLDKLTDKLTEENRRLHDQLTQWQAYAALLATKANPPSVQYQNNFATPTQATSPSPDDVTTANASTTANTKTAPTTPRKAAPLKAVKPRTHRVVSRETLASIARKYNISLASLQAAN